MRGSSLPASMLTCASPRCVAASISPAAAPGSAARWPLPLELPSPARTEIGVTQAKG